MLRLQEGERERREGGEDRGRLRVVGGIGFGEAPGDGGDGTGVRW